MDFCFSPTKDRKKAKSCLALCVFISAALFSFPSILHADSVPNSDSAVETVSEQSGVVALDPAASKYREAFYMPHELRLKYPTYDCLDFVVTKQEDKEWNSFFSVITGFNDGILETQILKDVQTVDEARDYFEKYTKKIDYSGVQISEVSFSSKSAKVYQLYWVGQKAFPTLDEAQQAIDAVKKEIESSGQNFHKSVDQAKEYAQSFTGVEHEVAKESIPIKVKPNFQREEDIFFGAYDGVNPRRFWGKYPEEDWYLYQVVGESTYRNTNLESRSFNAQVAYFDNRIVIRGLKWLGSSIDPYIESNIRGDTTSTSFNNTVDFTAGFEYRPFRLNKKMAESPWTDWIRNIRLFTSYSVREPIKDIVVFSNDHDWRIGTDYFKEWGIDMPKEGEKDTWLWGELYWDYHFEKTDFTINDHYDGFIFNTAGKIGIKFPRIKLPQNPINDELVFMPYFLFDQVSTTQNTFFFQNRSFLGVGMRLMPFRTYRFLNSQWLFRTKIFAEYDGLGGVIYTKAEPPSSDVPNRDYRIGINFSLNRF